MTGRDAEHALDRGAWEALARRLSPYLDLAIGLAAAALSVPLSVAATLVAGLSLVWRRRRPVAAFTVFVTCCLVVTLTDHYIGLLSVLLLFSIYSLAAHSRRRNGVAGRVLCLLVFVGLAVLDVP